MSNTSSEKHVGERAVQVWLPETTLAALDRHLKEITAGIPGAKASRHGWIRDLVYRELASATPEGAALAVFRSVAQLDTRRLAPEDVGRQHHVAVERVLLGHRADVLVDAEDLLEQHQPRPLSGRGQCQITLEARGKGDPLGGDRVAHGRFSGAVVGERGVSRFGPCGTAHADGG